MAKAKLTRAEQQALTLRFGADRAIVQELLLPESARPLLAAILRNKIESLAPWPIEETAWGFQANGAGRGSNMAVAVGAIGRRALQVPLDALAARGLKPVAVEIDTGENQTPIILDHNSEVRRRRVSLVLRGVLGTLAAVVIAGGAVGSFLAYRDRSELAAIDARTEALKQQLIGKGGGSASGIVAAATTIVDARKRQRPLVAVLNELTHVIPNGSWLTAVDLLDGKVTIQGRGGVASDLVQALEASDTFSDVNFAAATQRDEQSGREIYSIAATIAPNAVAE